MSEKKMMNELASKDDFKGAAAAKKEVKELKALAEHLRAKNTMKDEKKFPTELVAFQLRSGILLD